MKFIRDKNNYTLRFQKGEELISKLREFIIDQEIGAGWILGLGGLSKAELGYYSLADRDYHWTEITGELELCSLTGNIAWQNNEPALHLHATVSDEHLQTKGGHVKTATVAGTVELFIQVADDEYQLTRQRDEETGLNLLQL